MQELTDLLVKNGQGWLPVRGKALNWLSEAAMRLLWFGSTVIYGGVSARLSSMGPILGWPLLMSVVILTSNAWGFATGEWKGAGGKALTIMLLGILLLIRGFITLALASRLG